VGTFTFTKKINTSTIGLPASSGMGGSLFGIKDKRFIFCHFQACAYCSE
jgi:glutaminase